MKREVEKMLEQRRKRNNKHFVLQWHITSACPNRCRHCYIENSERKNEMSYELGIKIIDEFEKLNSVLGTKGRINFTGGDPLLKDEIYELIRCATSKGIDVGILGNPELLTLDTALRLKKIGVSRYQISIDGLKETHDFLRRKGSYDKSLQALDVLYQAGIPSVVMFTLSKLNMKDLIPLIRIVAERNVYLFDFARLVPVGRGKDLINETIEPFEYRNLLIQVLEEYRRLKKKGCKTIFGRKDHLWKLLYMELGLWYPPKNINQKMIYGGCAVGINLLTLLPNGIVYSCRRVPILIGKFPDQSLLEIFLKSKLLNEMRQEKNIEGCRDCELLQFCRGCRGVALGSFGSFFARDPQCWRFVENKK